MTRISSHASDRLQQRMRCVKGHPVGFLISLWNRGQQATMGDFEQFQVARRQGRRYRVVQHERRLYMLVRDSADGEFITVIKL